MMKVELAAEHRAALAEAQRRMRVQGAGTHTIGQFTTHFLAVAAGAQGLIPEDSIRPVDALPALSAHEVDDDGLPPSAASCRHRQTQRRPRHDDGS
ncbi:MAG: hypothetical protein IPN45_03800 [Actinomycetales bacterium]|nr:hypothetical protein [Actinomycetales bacterium]